MFPAADIASLLLSSVMGNLRSRSERREPLLAKTACLAMSGRAKFEPQLSFVRPLIPPGKIIGKSWDLRFRAGAAGRAAIHLRPPRRYCSPFIARRNLTMTDSSKTLDSVTEYHSFGGEVEALKPPITARLLSCNSRRFWRTAVESGYSLKPLE